jgi:hypothetical protein
MPAIVSPLISRPKLAAGKSSLREAAREKGGAGTNSSGQPRATKAMKIRAQIAELEAQLRHLNAVEVPKVILPELHDAQTGRIDAQKLADFMGTPLKPLAEGLGFNYKAVHRNPSAATYQSALRQVKRSLELLQEFFGKDEAIRIWLNTPHPDLEGATALETILAGKADAVLLILENAWNGVPV